MSLLNAARMSKNTRRVWFQRKNKNGQFPAENGVPVLESPTELSLNYACYITQVTDRNKGT